MVSARARLAAEAVLDYVLNSPSYTATHLAALIHDAAGIGELEANELEQMKRANAASRDWLRATAERNALRRRLEAVEALHKNDTGDGCDMCGCMGPCPTLRAARGEE